MRDARQLNRGADPTTPFKSGVLLWLAYDGAEFAGMARQPHCRTVAGELAGAIETMDPRASALRQVSRTDAGVHARGQIVAFDSTREIASRGWVLGLTKQLPKSIAVVSAAMAPVGFEPRQHVQTKVYRYRVLQSRVRDPFLDRIAWRIDQRLNHEAMNREAADLIGTHDFAAFRGAADARTDTIRTIRRACWTRDVSDARLLCFEIEGDRFLYHMVRIIVGTLVDVGRGRTNPAAVQSALASLQRSDLGMTAPAMGLELTSVKLDYLEFTERWPSVDEAESPA